MPALFDLQGHRGARGLKPENTLPSFEIAFDLGVTSIETDIQLTRDNVPVLFHDPVLCPWLCRRISDRDVPDPAGSPMIHSLSLQQLRGYRADINADPRRFPAQDPSVPPLAHVFAQEHALDPYTPPTLADLYAFADAYSGAMGTAAGKTPAQQEAARKVRFDLELKRVPFYPHYIGDTFDGSAAALLEQRVVETVWTAGMVGRTGVRSFDHRCVRALRRLEPELPAAVLIADTAPIAPVQLVRQADAETYCPNFESLDAAQVHALHAEGMRVVPWTVNEADAWLRLLDWGVDGITTDFPNRLAELLRKRGVRF